MKEVEALKKSNVIRFIDWYPEDSQPGSHKPLTKMTVGIGGSYEHPLSKLAEEFKQKCIEYYEEHGE